MYYGNAHYAQTIQATDTGAVPPQALTEQRVRELVREEMLALGVWHGIER